MIHTTLSMHTRAWVVVMLGCSEALHSDYLFVASSFPGSGLGMSRRLSQTYRGTICASTPLPLDLVFPD